MRFKITLTPDKRVFGYALPINYQYELSSFIYHTLACADAEYSTWLHENGFVTDTKRFKLFSFSNLIFPAYKIVSDRIEILWNVLPLSYRFSLSVVPRSLSADCSPNRPFVWAIKTPKYSSA